MQDNMEIHYLTYESALFFSFLFVCVCVFLFRVGLVIKYSILTEVGQDLQKKKIIWHLIVGTASTQLKYFCVWPYNVVNKYTI